MSEYVIMTDSSCDLPAKMADELGLVVLPLTVRVNDDEYYNYLDERELKMSDFYDKLREDANVSTAAVNVDAYNNAMEPILHEGKDILCISFSSGLSNTFNAGRLAAEEMREKYPDRTIFVIDSLCASLGQGLLLDMTVKQIREKNLTIEQAVEYVEKVKLDIEHLVVVDNLHYLKKGGRISSTSEAIGSMLKIKPIICVNKEGKLINIDKARGMKGALNNVLCRVMQTGVDLANQKIFICHADAIDTANKMADLLREKAGVNNIVINTVGPVVGAHTGPGLIAVFFIGRRDV